MNRDQMQRAWEHYVGVDIKNAPDVAKYHLVCAFNLLVKKFGRKRIGYIREDWESMTAQQLKDSCRQMVMVFKFQEELTVFDQLEQDELDRLVYGLRMDSWAL